jgi:hypothetical protein
VAFRGAAGERCLPLSSYGSDTEAAEVGATLGVFESQTSSGRVASTWIIGTGAPESAAETVSRGGAGKPLPLGHARERA